MLSMSSGRGKKGHLTTLSHTQSWSLKVSNLCLLNSNKKGSANLISFHSSQVCTMLLRWPYCVGKHTHTHSIYIYILSGQVNLWSLISNCSVIDRGNCSYLCDPDRAMCVCNSWETLWWDWLSQWRGVWVRGIFLGGGGRRRLSKWPLLWQQFLWWWIRGVPLSPLSHGWATRRSTDGYYSAFTWDTQALIHQMISVGPVGWPDMVCEKEDTSVGGGGGGVFHPWTCIYISA